MSFYKSKWHLHGWLTCMHQPLKPRGSLTRYLTRRGTLRSIFRVKIIRGHKLHEGNIGTKYCQWVSCSLVILLSIFLACVQPLCLHFVTKVTN